MKESSLVKRYAKALVLAMENQGEFDRVSAELHDFLALLAADEKLQAGLATFLISQAEKIEVLDIVNAKMGLHAKTMQFLLTVAAENRLAYLDQMVRQLPDAWYAERGIEKIIVSSAVELAAGQKERLLDKLEKALAGEVALEYRLEPDLIAGISLSRGSVQYDFSLSGSLKKLRETLVGEN